jgi:hypothetical protein
MKLVLSSDFVDYYDTHFDVIKSPTVHSVFRRSSKDRTARLELLSHMREQMSLMVPAFGTVREVARLVRFDQAEKHLVVYTNEFSHSGDGKERVGLKSALSRFPLKPCSLYMEPDEKSQSFKYISIGSEIRFLLRYTSNHTWKSNVGDVSIEMVEYTGEPIVSYNYPMFAIDFVMSNKVPYAVDFNASPKLSGTPVEDILEPGIIVKEIKKWMMDSMS